MFKAPECYRVTQGVLATDRGHGNNGAFLIPATGHPAAVIASDQDGWEMVSIAHCERPLTLAEVDAIRDLFWSQDDVVIQFHFPHQDRKGQHRYAVKLWRRAGQDAQLPPRHLLGVA